MQLLSLCFKVLINWDVESISRDVWMSNCPHYTVIAVAVGATCSPVPPHKYLQRSKNPTRTLGTSGLACNPIRNYNRTNSKNCTLNFVKLFNKLSFV